MKGDFSSLKKKKVDSLDDIINAAKVDGSKPTDTSEKDPAESKRGYKSLRMAFTKAEYDALVVAADASGRPLVNYLRFAMQQQIERDRDTH